MSSAPIELVPTLRPPVRRSLRSQLTRLALLAIGGTWLTACHAAAQAHRINPGTDPAEYRVSCDESFKQCERKVREVCGQEYQELSRESNHPEPKEVEITGVTSTAPSDGVPNWRGEMVVTCGRAIKPLRLVREPATETAPTAGVSPAQSPAAARVCVPGVTQACLGPGACSGAQACNAEGTGFAACDCGPANSAPTSAPNPTTAPVPEGSGTADPTGQTSPATAPLPTTRLPVSEPPPRPAPTAAPAPTPAQPAPTPAPVSPTPATPAPQSQ